MSDEWRPVVLEYNGKTYGLPDVRISPSRLSEKDQREENEMWAMDAIHDAFRLMRGSLPEMQPQQVYLRVVTAVVKAQYGKRDEPAEHETSVRYFRHYGFLHVTNPR